MDISLRQASIKDHEFLWNLHKTTMKNYVDKTWGWDEQFQKEYFDNQFDTKNIQIIEVENTSIGAIEVQNRQKEIYIANFKIDPDFQNQGIGSSILNSIINTSKTKHKPIKLQVLKVNPAKKLYERRGFETIVKTKTHFMMERSLAS